MLEKYFNEIILDINNEIPPLNVKQKSILKTLFATHKDFIISTPEGKRIYKDHLDISPNTKENNIKNITNIRNNTTNIKISLIEKLNINFTNNTTDFFNRILEYRQQIGIQFLKDTAISLLKYGGTAIVASAVPTGILEFITNILPLLDIIMPYIDILEFKHKNLLFRVYDIIKKVKK